MKVRRTHSKPYNVALLRAEAAVLLRNIVDGLRAAGWWLFEFNKNEQGFFVTVKHPPKLDNGEMAENRFVMGVAAGILESL